MKYGKQVTIVNGDDEGAVMLDTQMSDDGMTLEEFESVAQMVADAPPPTYSEGGRKFSFADIKWFGVGKFCMYALFIALPLVLAPFTVAPVEIHKTIFATVLLGVAFIAFLVDGIDKRSISYPRSLTAIAVCGFVAVVAVSAFFSKAVTISTFGNLVQPDSFLSFLLYGIGFFLSFYFLERDDVKKLGIYMTAVITFLVILTGLQVAGLSVMPWDFAKQVGFTTVGTFTGLGVLFGASLVMIVALLYNKRVFGRPQQYLVAIAVALLLLLACFKMPLLWIGIGLLMLIAAGIQFTSGRAIGVLLALISVSLFFVLVNPYLPQLATVPNEIRPSVASSFAVAYKVLTSSRFLLGYGPSTFPFAFSLYRNIDPSQLDLLGYTFLQGYNIFTTLLTTTGILGLLSFLVLILLAGYRLVRGVQDPLVAIIASGLLFLTLSLFLFPATFTHLFLLFAGLGLVLKLEGAQRTISFSSIARGPLFVVFVVGIAVIAGSLSGVYLIGRKYASAVYYGKSLTALASGNIDDGIGKLNQAVNLDSTADAYWRTGSQALLLETRQFLDQTKGKGGANQAQLENIVGLAVKSATRATELNPSDPLNWSNLGNVFENLIPIATGADEQAATAYKKAIELNPKNPQEPVNLARALLTSAITIENSQGQNETSRARVAAALVALQQSADIAPNYAPTNFSLVQLYIKQGEIQKASQKIQEIQSLSPLDAGLAYQLGLIAYQNNQPDIAQAQFERAVALYPDYSNALYFLGIIYDGKGLKTQAKAVFERLLQLNPDNEDIKKIVSTYAVSQPLTNNPATSTTPIKKEKK